ncbi:MAG: FAD/NAD(P)-binding protein [Puia sp.]
MGGLVCGNILSKQGYTVCMIEKNKQLGGCLQIYVRNKVIFDSVCIILVDWLKDKISTRFSNGSD